MNQTLSLAQLIVVCEDITGRKKLQKIVHLLQVSGYYDEFSYAFSYLHYGPYSPAVKNDLDILKESQLIEECETSAGEHPTFRYSATTSLAKGLVSVGLSQTPPWAERARQLNSYPPQLLEAASTIAFLQERGFGEDRLRTRFGELKPSLVPLYADAGRVLAGLLAPA